MIDMEMSYSGSALKFHHHPTWNHVWDCLVITDLRPIFSHLSSPLLSSPVSCSFELTPCGEGWWIPSFPKAHMLGVLLFEARSPLSLSVSASLSLSVSHTHTHTYVQLLWDFGAVRINELQCCVPLRPTFWLKKSCITTTEIGCFCLLSHALTHLWCLFFLHFGCSVEL